MPNETIDAFLGELKRLDEAATPGPWEFDEDGGLRSEKTNHTESGSLGRYESDSLLITAYQSISRFAYDDDGKFIAAARNAIPRLCEMVEYLWEQVDFDPDTSGAMKADLERILNGETG